MEESQTPVFVQNAQNNPMPEPMPSQNPPVEGQKPKRATGKLIGIIVILLLLTGLIIAATKVDFTIIADAISGSNFTPTSEMKALIDELKLTEDGRRIMMATHPELQESEAFNKNCNSNDPGTSVLGCYANNHIYVYNITHQDLEGIRQTTLAHELLHAVWSRMRRYERAELEADLATIHDSDANIKKKLLLYDEASFYDELHSVVGTQIAPDQMSETLRNHYSKYFSYFGSIVSFYNSYSTVYESAVDRANELKTIIEEHSEKCQMLLSEYEAEKNRLNNDIDNFNQRANTPGGFATQEEFDSLHSKLLGRQNELLAKLQTMNAYIEETNKYIAEYNANIARTAEYIQSIDSNSEKPKETN